MKRDKLNTRVLRQLAANAKAERTKRFNSPGVLGRRKPTLKLVGPLAQGLHDVRPGTAVKLSISGRVTGVGTRGQRDETTIEVSKVRRTRR